VGAWFLGALAGGMANVFLAPPSQPPLALLIAVVGPVLVFALLYRTWPRFCHFVLAIDLRWLTAVQGWRVLGGLFLALYAFGLLPGLFAWPAGAGDMAVGLAAPFVLLAILRRSPTWRRQVLWLYVAGLVDFAGAVGTGVLTSASSLGLGGDVAARAQMGALPLSLIPTFAVPLWTVFHAISLLQLRRITAPGASAA